MTYFQDDNGNQIQIDEDLQLYKSAINLFDFTIKGNFSTSFQVPNNSYFKNNFQYFTPLQIPSNGFKATIFNMIKNGNVIERGQLILEREDDDFLYFYFISGNANWITLIPDISIKDIDYETYAIQWDGNIIPYQNATNGFCFPLLDGGFGGNKISYQLYPGLFYDANYNTKNFVLEFYPCFFLKNAISEILKYCQLKISGDILNDPIYQQMIITPDSGQIQRADKFYTDRKVSVSTSSNKSFAYGGTKLLFDQVNENGSLSCWDSVNQKYTANKSCLLNITFNINLNNSSYARLIVFKNGTPYKSLDPAYVNNGPFIGTYRQNNNSFVLLFNDYGNWDSSVSIFIPPFLVKVSNGDILEFYLDFGGSHKGNFDASGGSFPGGAHSADTWLVVVAGIIGGTSPVHVAVGDVIQAKFDGATNNSNDWVLCKAGSGFFALSGSMISIEPVKTMSIASDIDTLRASDILPDIKMIDFIKFISNYFCAIPIYDETTSTLSFSKLDNYDYLQAKDWSQYLQKLENNFQIQTAKYNYFRFNKVDDPIVNALDAGKTLNYGDSLIQGQSSTTITNEVYKFPFGATIDKLGITGLMSPLLSLFEIEYYNDPISISSITNDGSGHAKINLASSLNAPFMGLQIFYIFGSNSSYNGYTFSFEIFNTTNYILSVMPYIGNSTGFVRQVKFKIKSNQSRILFYTGNQKISDISSSNSILMEYYGDLGYYGSGGYPVNKTNLDFAYFSKPQVGLNINSSYKQGLNLDYYQGGYNDIPRRLDYYKNLTRILNAPYIKGWFYLPEAVYAAFNFDTFIFIKDEDQQRYYYVDSIENYKDSKTLVQVNMLLLP